METNSSENDMPHFPMGGHKVVQCEKGRKKEGKTKWFAGIARQVMRFSNTRESHLIK